VQVLREHFRQTFQISRRYMERLRYVKAVRVALLDPVTGQRMPSSIWGEMTVAATMKGTMMHSRKDEKRSAMYYQIDSYPDEEERTVKKPPGPQKLTFLDRDAGIFRVTASGGTYGTYNTVIPGFTVNSQGNKNVAIMDLGQQDDPHITHGAGMRIQTGTNEFLLNERYKFLAMITIVPGSPNNKNRCHKERVGIDEVRKMFENRVKIEEGEGPPIDIFIPAGEMTARYAWSVDDQAKKSIITMLGLDDDDPTTGGLEGDEARRPPGLVWVNEQREIWAHSRGVAAEAYSAYISAIQGRVTTRVPDGNSKFSLTGNMSGASISVDGHPSAKVKVTSEFAGRLTPVSRLALMPESARKVVLGIVRFAKD
jgi:hypothetical protein